MDQYFKGIIFPVIFFTLFTSLADQKRPVNVGKKKKVVVKQQHLNPVICGYVYRISGNHLPDPDKPIKQNKAVSREILIYKLTNLKDTEGDGISRFTKIRSQLVKKVFSNKKGRFCTNLPIGKYSVFINDPNFGLFANNFDDQMNICPINIIKGNNSEIVLQLNHSAVF